MRLVAVAIVVFDFGGDPSDSRASRKRQRTAARQTSLLADLLIEVTLLSRRKFAGNNVISYYYVAEGNNDRMIALSRPLQQQASTRVHELFAFAAVTYYLIGLSPLLPAQIRRSTWHFLLC